MAKKSQSVLLWLAFDLGVEGDYESLYAWLDEHEARECGDSVACLSYSYEGDLLDSIKKDLKSRIEFTKRARVYLVREGERGPKGSFIIGTRRAAPWTGYAAPVGAALEDDA